VIACEVRMRWTLFQSTITARRNNMSWLKAK
jgi:hypothetical protein